MARRFFLDFPPVRLQNKLFFHLEILASDAIFRYPVIDRMNALSSPPHLTLLTGPSSLQGSDSLYTGEMETATEKRKITLEKI